MRTPAPRLVFQGPVVGVVEDPVGTLSPKPPDCWTAQPCGEA